VIKNDSILVLFNQHTKNNEISTIFLFILGVKDDIIKSHPPHYGGGGAAVKGVSIMSNALMTAKAIVELDTIYSDDYHECIFCKESTIERRDNWDKEHTYEMPKVGMLDDEFGRKHKNG